MSFKGSGVYAVITDQSQQPGSAGLGASAIFPMLTKRGNPFEVVTLDNYQDKVGYDLNYNQGYLGLVTALQAMSQVTVMRLNKNAYAGNIILFQSGRYMSQVNLTTPSSFGNPVPAYQSLNITSTAGYSVTTPIKALQVSGAGTVNIYQAGTATLWSSDQATAGTMVAAAGSGITGTITYNGTNTVIALTFTGTKNFDLVFTPDEIPIVAISMNSVGNWGPIGIVNAPSTKTVQLATADTVTIGEPVAASSIQIYNAGVLIAHDNAGTLVADNSSGVVGTTNVGAGTITFSTQPTGSLLTIQYVQATPSSYNLAVYRQVSSTWTLLEAQDYNLNINNATLYLGNLIWNNIFALPIGTAFSGSGTFGSSGSPLTLDGANDGTMQLSTEVDPTQLAARTETFLVMNGLNQPYQNVFLNYVDINDRFHVICDAPAYPTYDQTAAWKLGLRATNRAGLYAVQDYVLTAIGTLPIQPSVKVMLGYANMFSKTGTLKYPVAGYTFGSTTATSLLATDFVAHPADLKNSKINYIKIGSQGPVIWEERSLYGQESDLSYCYVTFILDDIVSTVSSFISSYVFKLIGALDLVRIQSGLDQIINDQINQGFLWSGKAEVPTFEEVKNTGIRQATIPVTVQVAQDGEEWTINVILTNVAVA